MIDYFSLLTRPSVYVISDSQLETYKRNQAEAEIIELDRLIESHRLSIERLERTRGDLRTNYPVLEPKSEEQYGTITSNRIICNLRSYLWFHICLIELGAYQRLSFFMYYILKVMTELQIQAALRMKAALLAQSKEKARDLFYLRKAGSKGVSVA